MHEEDRRSPSCFDPLLQSLHQLSIELPGQVILPMLWRTADVDAGCVVELAILDDDWSSALALPCGVKMP